MNLSQSNSKPKVIVLQRVCPNYRVALFERLTHLTNMAVELFIGDDVPNTKVKSAVGLEGVVYRRLKTRFVNILGRVLPWHVGLINTLRVDQPDIILCEAESNFFGYVQAIVYKVFFNRKVSLVHWCYIELPGVPNERNPFLGLLKRFTRTFFSAFVVYSSFSQKALLKRGIDEDKIFVATNVGDTDKFISQDLQTLETTTQAKQKLALPAGFTVLFLGTLDANKHPDMLLDLAQRLPSDQYNFVLLGGGNMLEALRLRVKEQGLSNVFLPGRVVDLLPLYLRSADTLMIPGRGGIIMSEAMCFGVPVIVHQADGTEYDLIDNDVTGILLEQGSLDEFEQAVTQLNANPQQYQRLANNSRELINTHFSTDYMLEQVVKALLSTQQKSDN